MVSFAQLNRFEPRLMARLAELAPAHPVVCLSEVLDVLHERVGAFDLNSFQFQNQRAVSPNGQSGAAVKKSDYRSLQTKKVAEAG